MNGVGVLVFHSKHHGTVNPNGTKKNRNERTESRLTPGNKGDKCSKANHNTGNDSYRSPRVCSPTPRYTNQENKQPGCEEHDADKVKLLQHLSLRFCPLQIAESGRKVKDTKQSRGQKVDASEQVKRRPPPRRGMVLEQQTPRRAQPAAQYAPRKQRRHDGEPLADGHQLPEDELKADLAARAHRDERHAANDRLDRLRLAGDDAADQGQRVAPDDYVAAAKEVAHSAHETKGAGCAEGVSVADPEIVWVRAQLSVDLGQDARDQAIGARSRDDADGDGLPWIISTIVEGCVERDAGLLYMSRGTGGW